MKAAIGVSPRNAAAYDDEVEKALRETASQKAVCAIGSCGLTDGTDEAQVRAFTRQIALAHEFGMPLIVEAECAYAEALALLSDCGIPEAGVLLRAFWGTEEELHPWIEAGCYVSFDVRVADDPVKGCALADFVPSDRVLVESGAPETTTDILAGFDARCDQVVFAADAIIGICPSAQMTANYQTLFGK